MIRQATRYNYVWHTGSKKSEMELLEEDAMVEELVVLVERRSKLVWDLHEEKQM